MIIEEIMHDYYSNCASVAHVALLSCSVGLLFSRSTSTPTNNYKRNFNEIIFCAFFIYGVRPSFHYLSEIKGQEVDIVMITEVEDVRIASTLLPLNFTARSVGRLACEELFCFSTFQPFRSSLPASTFRRTFQLIVEAKWK